MWSQPRSRQSSLLTSFLGLSLSCLLLSAGPFSEEKPDWTGCWRAPGGEVLLLEPARCARLQEGKASFHRLATLEEGVRLERWGRVTNLKLQLVDGDLQVESEGGLTIFKSLKAVPEELSVPSFELPAGPPLDAETIEFVQIELREREAEDQRVRAGAMTGTLSDEVRKAMVEVDSENTLFLTGLILELGWIDVERFGAEASNAAFLLVQHSGDARLMRTALGWMDADVKAGRMGGQGYALLYDRLQLDLGYLQRYGSQLSTLPSGETVLMPCEDLETVDERRRSMGMGPLAAYLAYFQDDDDPVPIRMLEEALEAPRGE